eukprot:g2174.t1
MGNGASLQAQSALNCEASKPLDASDVRDFGSAKIELINARRQAQFYRNQALPKYQVDTTGNGQPNAIGYDTNANGYIDSLDTTMDGLIDTAVVVYGQQTYFVPVGNLGTALPFTRANNGQYVVTEEPKSDLGCCIAAGAGAALAVVGLSALSKSEAANNLGNSLVPDAVDGVVGVTVVGGALNVAQSDVAQGAGTQVMNGVQVVGSTIGEGIEQAMSSDAMQNVGNGIQSVGAEAMNGAQVVGSTIGEGIEQAMSSDAMQNVGNGIQSVGAEAMNGAQVVGSTIGEGIEQAMSSDAMQNVGNGIQSVGAEAMDGAQVVVGQAIDLENMASIGNHIQQGGQQLVEGGQVMAGHVVQGTGQAFNQENMAAVGNTFESGANTLSSGGGVVDKVLDGGAELMEAVGGAVGSVVNSVGDAVGGAGKEVVGAVGTVLEAVGSAVKSVIE